VFTCTDSERIERATLYGLSQRAQLSLEKKEKRKEEGTKKAPMLNTFGGFHVK